MGDTFDVFFKNINWFEENPTADFTGDTPVERIQNLYMALREWTVVNILSRQDEFGEQFKDDLIEDNPNKPGVKSVWTNPGEIKTQVKENKEKAHQKTFKIMLGRKFKSYYGGPGQVPLES